MHDGDGRDTSGLFQVQKDLDLLATETAALLAREGVQLALAEAGTGGEIADRLSARREGQAVLSHAHVYGAAEELAAGLRVSPAKVAAFGASSAMVAAEAAAALIDTYEGGWGLVVLAPVGNLTAEPGVPSQDAATQPSDAGQGFVALGTPSTTVIQQCSSGQIVRTTLELLREQAERRRRINEARTGQE